MASTKTIEAKLDKLSGDLVALRLEVFSNKTAKQKASPDAKASWLRLGRKVSRSWKTGTAAEEIATQRVVRLPSRLPLRSKRHSWPLTASCSST